MVALLSACTPGPVTPTPAASPQSSPVPTVAAIPSPIVPLPAAVPLPSPSPLAALPTPAPSPTPIPARLIPGELPLDTATLSYLSEGGFPTSVDGLPVTCTRIGDSLGLTGASLQGPVVARFQVTIAPFGGDGGYRAERIGGSVTIPGQVQLFVGPPYETTADVGRDGALGRLRFSGLGIDGRRGDGTIRWECSDVRRGS